MSVCYESDIKDIVRLCYSSVIQNGLSYVLHIIPNGVFGPYLIKAPLEPPACMLLIYVNNRMHLHIMSP